MNQSLFPPSLWNGFNRLQGEVNRLLEPWVAAPERPTSLAPRVNVWEDAEAFHVEAEVPGVPQDQVEVFVTDCTRLTVRGERRAEAPANGSWLCREHRAGRFERVLELPLPVEADRVEARLEHGVLFLTLPKAEAVRPRRVTVKAG